MEQQLAWVGFGAGGHVRACLLTAVNRCPQSCGRGCWWKLSMPRCRRRPCQAGLRCAADACGCRAAYESASTLRPRSAAAALPQLVARRPGPPLTGTAERCTSPRRSSPPHTAGCSTRSTPPAAPRPEARRCTRRQSGTPSSSCGSCPPRPPRPPRMHPAAAAKPQGQGCRAPQGRRRRLAGTGAAGWACTARACRGQGGRRVRPAASWLAWLAPPGSAGGGGLPPLLVVLVEQRQAGAALVMHTGAQQRRCKPVGW